MKVSIYQHFRKHEHPFVDQVLSWKEQVERTYISYLTDFLDPRERQMIRSIIGPTNEEVKYSFFGGANEAERQRGVIAPFYEEMIENDFQIMLLEGTFANKFNQLKHRDILGAFLSLGIDRKKIGDILIDENRFQIVVTQELSPYIKMNLTKIKNARVQLVEQSLSNMLHKKDEWMTSNHTVSSLRLDIIVKEIYRMSRKDAAQHIRNHRVKVNFKNVDDPSVQIIVDDLISVRGYGRSKLIAIHGKTRKEKIKITTARLKT